MSNKIFAERLNRELDNIGAPIRENERIEAFSKMFSIPKFKAEGYLHGIIMPDTTLLEKFSEEFEVSKDWLIGLTDKKA